MARILVIDDEAIIRKRLKNLLELDGYETFTAGDGQEGLKVFRKENPEIALVDVKMPGMSGIEVLKKIQEETAIGTEVIIITGHGGVDTAIEALREGAFGYIQKPVDYDELEIEIKRALEKQEMQKKLDEYINDLEIVNEKLKELDKVKTNFLSTVSHELRTPLASIKAFAEILLDNQEEDQETKMKFLKIINDESDRLAKLIDDLLDIARIESGRQVWEMNNYAIGDIIEESATAVLPLSEKNHLMIERKTPDGLPEIYGDHDKLVQVVTNLLSNAIKFTNSGSVITVSAEVIEDQIQVSVKDKGIVIPEEQIDKIFEKFYQVDASPTREKGGTGLGLAICKEIVEHHQGKIWVESQIGEGNTFYFTVVCRKEDKISPAEGDRFG
jgi:signal transduction histidine kinase